MHIVMTIEDKDRYARVDIYVDGDDLTFVPQGDLELAGEAIESIINADYDEQTPITKN